MGELPSCVYHMRVWEKQEQSLKPKIPQQYWRTWEDSVFLQVMKLTIHVIATGCGTQQQTK